MTEKSVPENWIIEIQIVRKTRFVTIKVVGVVESTQAVINKVVVCVIRSGLLKLKNCELKLPSCGLLR